jgi:hypothetical protein
VIRLVGLRRFAAGLMQIKGAQEIRPPPLRRVVLTHVNAVAPNMRETSPSVIVMTRRLAFVFVILAAGVQPGGASLDTSSPTIPPLHSLVGLTDQDATRMMDMLDAQPVEPPTRKRAPRRPRLGPDGWQEP